MRIASSIIILFFNYTIGQTLVSVDTIVSAEKGPKMYLDIITEKGFKEDKGYCTFEFSCFYWSVTKVKETYDNKSFVETKEITSTKEKVVTDEATYFYKLQGYETTWNTTQNKNIYYDNLELGNYTLKVYANHEGAFTDTLTENIVIRELDHWSVSLYSDLPIILDVILMNSGNTQEDIEINDDYVPFNWSEYTDSLNENTGLPKYLLLNADQNNLKFLFDTKIGPGADRKIRAILEGYNEDWIEIGYFQRSLNYIDLEPGDYTFKVCTESYGCDEDYGTFAFTIAPPFYQSNTFQIASASLFLLLLGGGVYVNRVRKYRKKRKEAEINRKLAETELKALRAQMNPHFLFNTLSSIQSLVNTNDLDGANKYISKYAQLTRMILDHSDKTTVPLSEELLTLELYVELESLRFNFNHKVEVDKSVDLYNLEIPPTLIQPFVENAINHGIAGKGKEGMVSVKLQQSDNLLICTIEDNGIGRKVSEEQKSKNQVGHRSYGISLTKERLKVLNARYGSDLSIDIQDLYTDNKPSGTLVNIYITLS